MTTINKHFGKLVLGFSSALLLLQGCSFTPYHDDFSCNKGIGEGRCDSVSNVYEYSLNSKKSKNAKRSENNMDDDVEQSCNDKINLCFTDFNPDKITYIGYVDKTKKCVLDVINNCKDMNDKTKKKIEEVLYYQQLRNEQLAQKVVDQKGETDE